MPTTYGLPTLYEAEPYPGSPRCFVSRYDMAGNTINGESMGMGGEILIWGYSCRSSYEEDRPREDLVWNERHGFPCVCFSTVETDGEYGFTNADHVKAVEAWMLEAALADLGVDWVDPVRAVEAHVLEAALAALNLPAPEPDDLGDANEVTISVDLYSVDYGFGKRRRP
jgi:hypothetical protein